MLRTFAGRCRPGVRRLGAQTSVAQEVERVWQDMKECRSTEDHIAFLEKEWRADLRNSAGGTHGLRRAVTIAQQQLSGAHYQQLLVHSSLAPLLIRQCQLWNQTVMSFSPLDMVNMAWIMAELGARDQGVIQAMAAELERAMQKDQLDAALVPDLVYAWGELRIFSEPLLQQLKTLTSSREELQKLSGRDVSALALGSAFLNHNLPPDDQCALRQREILLCHVHPKLSAFVSNYGGRMLNTGALGDRQLLQLQRYDVHLRHAHTTSRLKVTGQLLKPMAEVMSGGRGGLVVTPPYACEHLDKVASTLVEMDTFSDFAPMNVGGYHVPLRATLHSFVLEVLGRHHHFSVDNRRPVRLRASACLRLEALLGSGLKVAALPFYEWNAVGDRHYLRQKCLSKGHVMKYKKPEVVDFLMGM